MNTLGLDWLSQYVLLRWSQLGDTKPIPTDERDQPNQNPTIKKYRNVSYFDEHLKTWLTWKEVRTKSDTL